MGRGPGAFLSFFIRLNPRYPRSIFPLLFLQIHCAHRYVPMGGEDFESALFFPLERFLVGKELLEHGFITRIVVRHLDIFPDDRDPVIPAIIFVSVVNRRFGGHLEGDPQLDLFLEERIMVLLEQLHELVGESPFRPCSNIRSRKAFRPPLA